MIEFSLIATYQKLGEQNLRTVDFHVSKQFQNNDLSS